MDRIDHSFLNTNNNGENDWFYEISFETIDQEIKRLPVGCRQILILHLLEDYKHVEIAQLMNISESTSKSQYRYAKNLLP